MLAYEEFTVLKIFLLLSFIIKFPGKFEHFFCNPRLKQVFAFFGIKELNFQYSETLNGKIVQVRGVTKNSGRFEPKQYFQYKRKFFRKSFNFVPFLTLFLNTVISLLKSSSRWTSVFYSRKRFFHNFFSFRDKRHFIFPWNFMKFTCREFTVFPNSTLKSRDNHLLVETKNETYIWIQTKTLHRNRRESRKQSHEKQ